MTDLITAVDKLESQNIIAWILKNEIKNERGMPIEFDKFAFMIDPYLDWTPQQGTRKCSQIGWSVMTNLKLVYAARHGIPGYGIPAANVIYTLPSDADVNEFVPSKTNALIANNRILGNYIKDESLNKRDVDSIRRKQIGQSFIYFKGTKSKSAALMLTSDLNIHDESDRSDKDVIDQYESRLGNSMYKGRWIFSNPSAPNMPADLLYQESDQKYWFIKCEHCGHWQYLDWKKTSEYTIQKAFHCYVDDVNGQYICSKCTAVISDENRKRGKWINKATSSVSGYWVSHMMCSWISAKQMLKTEATKSKAYFNNFALGLPYVGSDVVVDGQTIVHNIVLDEVRWTPGQVAMGVDNGDEKHFVIGDVNGIFMVGKTKSWDDIEKLINKFQPVCVIDLNPYPNKPRELARKYPMAGSRARVFCSFYVDETKSLELIEWGKGDKAHMVYPDRNKVFDDLINYIGSGNMKFFRAKAYWEEYIAHWETMYRADEERRNGIVQGIWQSSTKVDHYCHATLYYYVALSKIIGGSGKILQGDNSVKQIRRELGGVPTVPSPGINPNTIIPVRSFMPDLARMAKGTKKGGSTSGNM